MLSTAVFAALTLGACAMPDMSLPDLSDWKWPGQEKEDEGAKSRPTPPPDGIDARSAAYEGTVRSHGYVEGMRRLRLRGFGLVGGLANTGGKDCPAEIRRYLEAEIRRHNSSEDLRLEPQEILDSPRFAPVSVTAEVPAAAMKGDRFDLVVRALGNQTTSLEGGVLYLCDLKLFQPTPRGVIDGRTIASAEGPIYVSPFGRDPEAATPADPRVGRVLGGGRLGEDRRLRIVLNAPSYALAARIQERLNSRFPTAGKAADAVSPTTIQLNIPREQRAQAARFLQLVLHTAVDGSPASLQRRAAALAAELNHPMAPYEDIAMTWEAIGKSVLPVVRGLYDSRIEAAAYYAGRTGLRLGDDLALEVVARHAFDARSPFREQAVDEAAGAREVHRSAERLRALLSDADNRIRIRAYEALRKRGDRAVRGELIWGGAIRLDSVESDGEPLIYVRQTDEQRIAIFGRELAVRPPAMFSARDDLVTISATQGDDGLMLVRRNPLNNRVSDPIRRPLEVTSLVRFMGEAPRPSGASVRGLGLSYSIIVEALYELSRSHTIPAELVLERPQLSDSLGRGQSRDRPESEIPEEEQPPETGDEPAADSATPPEEAPPPSDSLLPPDEPRPAEWDAVDDDSSPKSKRAPRERDEGG